MSGAPQNHCSECGLATSVANADALAARELCYSEAGRGEKDMVEAAGVEATGFQRVSAQSRINRRVVFPQTRLTSAGRIDLRRESPPFEALVRPSKSYLFLYTDKIQ